MVSHRQVIHCFMCHFHAFWLDELEGWILAWVTEIKLAARDAVMNDLFDTSDDEVFRFWM